MPRNDPRKPVSRKVVDEVDVIRCECGVDGLLREEVWQDGDGAVVKYNLAFVNFGLCQTDNGRVLGYDNAHGYHERHDRGNAERTEFVNYEKTFSTFMEEVTKLKALKD